MALERFCVLILAANFAALSHCASEDGSVRNLMSYEKNLMPQSAFDVLQNLKPVYHSRRQVLDEFLQNSLRNRFTKSAGAVTNVRQYDSYPGARIPSRETVVVERPGQGYGYGNTPRDNTMVVVNVPNENQYPYGTNTYGRK